eukprot:scaffold3166_cov399-Prasinococcus_capsulatus_cf.AAC.21
MKDVSKIETAIESFCGSVDGWGGEKAQKMEPKEEKFCYVISPIKREVSKPATLGMPTKKVCEKASRIDEQICSLKYPAPPPDLATFTDEQFQKMRVKQLKVSMTEESVRRHSPSRLAFWMRVLLLYTFPLCAGVQELVTAYKKECKGCTEKSDYVDMLIKMRDAKTEL